MSDPIAHFVENANVEDDLLIFQVADQPVNTTVSLSEFPDIALAHLDVGSTLGVNRITIRVIWNGANSGGDTPDPDSVRFDTTFVFERDDFKFLMVNFDYVTSSGEDIGTKVREIINGFGNTFFQKFHVGSPTGFISPVILATLFLGDTGVFQSDPLKIGNLVQDSPASYSQPIPPVGSDPRGVKRFDASLSMVIRDPVTVAAFGPLSWGPEHIIIPIGLGSTVNTWRDLLDSDSDTGEVQFSSATPFDSGGYRILTTVES